jgi:radical SAM superfamily enzyme YgiQ (UPF0313 family)
MGGFHASLVPEEVSEYAEAVVVGEAEEMWAGLLKDFSEGRMQRMYRKEQRPALQSCVPDRSIFAGKRYLPVTLLETARGCTFKCEFCAIQTVFKSTQNRRDTLSVIQEIQSSPHRRKLFFFVDDNVVSHPEEFKEFLRQIIPLKIRWVGQATITMTRDKELLELMKRSGCQGVLIGFESLDEANLATMNKSFNHIRGGPAEAVRRLNAEGIRLYATFIFGYDNDSHAAFQQTLNFCLEHKIFMAAFNHLTPFPGTPLYSRLSNENRLLYDRWWLDPDYQYGDVPFTSNLPREEIRFLCQKLRRDFYSYRSIASRFLSRCNSAGAIHGVWMYWFINLLLHRDTESRYRYPLGDPSYQGELLKSLQPPSDLRLISALGT